MNWGTNLTLLGAIRLSGWVVLSTMFKTANRARFVAWFKAKLLPRLAPGDVVVMDNLPAHHDPRIAPACRARGVRVVYLPPYSPDLNWRVVTPDLLSALRRARGRRSGWPSRARGDRRHTRVD
jgi:hypothetical protein